MRGHWLGNTVPLPKFASELQQHLTVFNRLNTFGNNLPPKGVGHAKHAFQNGKVIRVIEHIAYETLVDLKLASR